MSSGKGPKHINPPKQKLYYYYCHLAGIQKKKPEKMTTKPCEQSRERLQVEWLLFPLNGSTLYQAKLARNYNILSFEFSKIVKRHERKSDKAYL